MPDVKEPSLKNDLFKMIVNQWLQSRPNGTRFNSEEALLGEIGRLNQSSDSAFLLELIELRDNLADEKDKYNEMTDEGKTAFIAKNLNYDIAKKALSELEENDKKIFIKAFYKELVSLSTQPNQSDILSLMGLEQVDEAIYKKIFVSLMKKTYKAIEAQANADYQGSKTVALKVPLKGDSLLIETDKLIREKKNLNHTNNLLIKHLESLAQKEIKIIFPENYSNLINLINENTACLKKLRTTRDDAPALAMSQAIAASFEFTPGKKSTKTNDLILARNKYCQTPNLESLMNFLNIASKPRGSWIRQKEFAETKSVETFFEKLPKDGRGFIKGEVCNELHVLNAMNKTISALKNKPFSGNKLKELRTARERYIIAVNEVDREASLKAFLVAAGKVRFRGEFAETNSIKVFYESMPALILSDILKLGDNKEPAQDSIVEYHSFKEKVTQFKNSIESEPALTEQKTNNHSSP